MFDDEQNSIDVESVLFPQRLGNRLTKFDTVLITNTGTQVRNRLLVIPHPNQFEGRLMMEPVSRVSVNKSARDMVGM